MSYEPTNWKSGDTVTSAKLNKMEQGIANAGGVLIVGATIVESSLVLDKTWQEISDADFAVLRMSFAEDDIVRVPVSETLIAGSTYTVNVYNAGELMAFTTDSADGYPAVPMG